MFGKKVMTSLVSDRNRIMKDWMFWLTLEYRFPDCIPTVEGTELKGLWYDGFAAETIENTTLGVRVGGKAWIMQGQNRCIRCDFIAHVPQKLLYRTIEAFAFTIDVFDPEEEFLEISVFPEAKRAEPRAAPNGGPAAPVDNSGFTEGPPSVS